METKTPPKSIELKDNFIIINFPDPHQAVDADQGLVERATTEMGMQGRFEYLVKAMELFMERFPDFVHICGEAALRHMIKSVKNGPHDQGAES